MNKRNLVLLLLLAVSCLWALPALAQEVKLGEGQSPAPTAADLPPGSQIYVVQPHDTLWSISARFWGRPFAWPKLWQENPSITNPHLIYPGDRIMLSPNGELVILPRGKTGSEVSSQVNLGLPTEEETLTALKYFNNNQEIGFIENKKPEALGIILSEKMDKRTSIAENDDVYIEMRNPDAFKVGTRVTVAQVGDMVRNPVTSKKLGYLVKYIATIKITKIESKKVAEGRVSNSIWDFHPDDLVVPYVAPPSEIKVIKAPPGVNGRVLVSVDANLQALSKYQMVLVDVGKAQGANVGNVFNVVWPPEKIEAAGDKSPVTIDEKVVAEVILLQVQQNTSLALIIAAVRDIGPGDLIKSREKGPEFKADAGK